MVRLEAKPPTSPTPEGGLRRIMVPVAIGTAMLVAVVILIRASADTDEIGIDRSASPTNGARPDSSRDRRQPSPPASSTMTGTATPMPTTRATATAAAPPAMDRDSPAVSPSPTAAPTRRMRHHHRRSRGHVATADPEGAVKEPSNRRHGQKNVQKDGQKVALVAASVEREPEWQRPPSEEDPNLKLVARFAATGGATLKGRVIDAESGKPPVGVAVEAHIGESFMKTTTDSAGGFRMSGILPGRPITVWIIGGSDTFVAERLDVTSPGEGEITDAGVVRLLRGDELTSHLEGWMGVFVNRQGQRNVVAAVSPWSPADRAGIEVGDILLSIAGRDVDGLGPRATGFLLRGPVGTKIGIAVQDRHGMVQRFQLERVLR